MCVLVYLLFIDSTNYSKLQILMTQRQKISLSCLGINWFYRQTYDKYLNVRMSFYQSKLYVYTLNIYVKNL